ncbi:hypothetical protein N9L79_04230 [Alphaproteobacteria bacterium]|nr:hypothetical protein [Alphaproteobacteria bacterium]
MSDILSSRQALNGPVTPPAMAQMGDPHDTSEGDTENHDFSFGDLVDIVNPLQHIPGVANVYRAITGDTISAPARFMGSMLFMGPVGLVMTAADTLAMNADGELASEQLIAAISGRQADSGIVTAKTNLPDTAPTSAVTATMTTAPAIPPAIASATTGGIGPNLPTEPSKAGLELQNISGSLLDNFIKNQGQGREIAGHHGSLSHNLFAAADPSRLAAVTAPIKRPAVAAGTANAADLTPNTTPRLTPPTAVNNQSGTELSSWMMRALDQYRAQAQNRPPNG